ncbi:MAG: hypothetical protein EBT98_06410, partial [Opitutaceae bacterium]|nr:hypothetical protein [Opitutaceae bacterium]
MHFDPLLLLDRGGLTAQHAHGSDAGENVFAQQLLVGAPHLLVGAQQLSVGAPQLSVGAPQLSVVAPQLSVSAPQLSVSGLAPARPRGEERLLGPLNYERACALDRVAGGAIGNAHRVQGNRAADHNRMLSQRVEVPAGGGGVARPEQPDSVDRPVVRLRTPHSNGSKGAGRKQESQDAIRRVLGEDLGITQQRSRGAHRIAFGGAAKGALHGGGGAGELGHPVEALQSL